MSHMSGNIMPLQPVFGAASMNDSEYSQLWVDGAAQFIPRLNQLLGRAGSEFPIVDVTTFQNPSQDDLGRLLEQHMSDKSTTHNYNILYSHIFDILGRNNPLNVLEVGLGTNNPSLVSSMGQDGRPGASIFAFRDYLPNSTIYGADIDKDILFQSDRIKTAFVDQMNPESFTSMQTDLGGSHKYDLIIDDGLHSIGANFNTLLFALDNLNTDGWFVVEDIGAGVGDNWKSIDFIMKTMPGFETFMVKTSGGYYYQNTSYMYVVHKKSG